VKKIICFMLALTLSFNANAQNIEAKTLGLSSEQNQKLTELKANLKAEIEPIWEEIQAGKARILEIEKKYFEQFWNLLTNEQKQKFAEQNKATK